jgi:hypothetical protein
LEPILPNTNKNHSSVFRRDPLHRTHRAGLTVVSQEEDRSHNGDKVQRQTEHVSDDAVYAHEPFPSDRLGDGLAELGDLSTGRGLGGGESAFLDEFAVVLGEQDLRHESMRVSDKRYRRL